MSHLTLETIARLVEDAPDAHEAEHLAACEQCRAELESMLVDVRALATLPDMTPAPDAWTSLERRLAAEGIIHAPRVRTFPTRPFIQAAAAVVLFVGGASAGRLTAPQQEQLAQAPSTQPADTRGTTLVANQPTVEASNPNVNLVSNTTPARVQQPRTMEEAAALLRQTEELYLGALTRYAELATNAEAGDPVSRLAALQSIVMTTQAALSQAPADPVINGYHLTALAQRDATLRQVAAATSDRWY